MTNGSAMTPSRLRAPTFAVRASVGKPTFMVRAATGKPTFAGQAGELRLEQAPDFFVAHAAGVQAFHGCRDDRLRRPNLVCLFAAPRLAGHERAGPMAQLDDALVLELAVRFR